MVYYDPYLNSGQFMINPKNLNVSAILGIGFPYFSLPFGGFSQPAGRSQKTLPRIMAHWFHVWYIYVYLPAFVVDFYGTVM